MKCRTVIAHDPHNWRQGHCPGITRQTERATREARETDAFNLATHLMVGHGLNVTVNMVRANRVLWRKVDDLLHPDVSWEDEE